MEKELELSALTLLTLNCWQLSILNRFENFVWQLSKLGQIKKFSFEHIELLIIRNFWYRYMYYVCFLFLIWCTLKDIFRFVFSFAFEQLLNLTGEFFYIILSCFSPNSSLLCGMLYKTPKISIIFFDILYILCQYLFSCHDSVMQNSTTCISSPSSKNMKRKFWQWEWHKINDIHDPMTNSLRNSLFVLK